MWKSNCFVVLSRCLMKWVQVIGDEFKWDFLYVGWEQRNYVWLQFKHLKHYGYKLMWWNPVNSGEIVEVGSQAGGARRSRVVGRCFLLHLNFKIILMFNFNIFGYWMCYHYCKEWIK